MELPRLYAHQLFGNGSSSPDVELQNPAWNQDHCLYSVRHFFTDTLYTIHELRHGPIIQLLSFRFVKLDNQTLQEQWKFMIFGIKIINLHRVKVNLIPRKVHNLWTYLTSIKKIILSKYYLFASIVLLTSSDCRKK